MKKTKIFMTCILSILGSYSTIWTAQNNTNTLSRAQIIALQQQSFIDQFNTLAAAGIPESTLAQIATIAPSLIPIITNDQIIKFTPSQIAAFTPSQIAAFTPSQIAAFTVPTTNDSAVINQISAFTLPQLTAMIPKQIAAMSSDQLKTILPTLPISKIQYLTSSQITALTTETLNNLLINLMPEQIKYISIPQIAMLGSAIAPFIDDLSPAQFASLSQAQIIRMNTDQLDIQLKNITIPQIGYLLPAQIATITLDQINTQLAADQLNALLKILQNATIITTSNNPNLTSQITAIISALAKISAKTTTSASSKKSKSNKFKDTTDTSLRVITSKTKAEKKSNAAIKKFFTI